MCPGLAHSLVAANGTCDDEGRSEGIKTHLYSPHLPAERSGPYITSRAARSGTSRPHQPGSCCSCWPHMCMCVDGGGSHRDVAVAQFSAMRLRLRLRRQSACNTRVQSIRRSIDHAATPCRGSLALANNRSGKPTVASIEFGRGFKIWLQKPDLKCCLC